MRKQVLLLLVVLLSLTGCDSWFADTNNAPGQEEALTGFLTGGKWKVVTARAGDEDISGMYQGYLIEFTADGQYIITNPTGAPNPNRNNPANNGLWDINTDNSITVDATVLMQILSSSRDRIEFQWNVTIIGKGTNVYYWELIPA